MNIDRITRLTRKNIRIANWLIDPDAWKGMHNGPKVLLNSVPKCGTNLLQEIVQSMPGMRGTFKRTVYGPVTEQSIKFVGSIQKGSCSTSHLYHNKELQDAITANNVTVLHMVRDFRDAIYSHIQFIEKLTPDHRHGTLFNKTTTFDEKLAICLFGIPDVITGWVDTLDKFSGWKDSSALIVKYEDLLTKDIMDTESQSEITRIADHLGISHFDRDKIVSKSNNPDGLTFNQPGIEKWKKSFTPAQLDTINNSIGKHLEQYGYSGN